MINRKESWILTHWTRFEQDYPNLILILDVIKADTFGTEGNAKEQGLVECGESFSLGQAEAVVVSISADDAHSAGRREEVFSRRVERRESKEKEAFMLRRRKKKAELERLKKSYLKELGKSNRTSQVSDSESFPDVVSLGVDEEARKKKGSEVSRMRQAGLVQNGENPSEHSQNSKEQDEEAVEKERRRLQREEAVESYKTALDLGVRGSLSEEGMIQLFEDHLQKEYEERCN